MKSSLVFGILLVSIVTITAKQYLLETEPEPEPEPENIVPLGPYLEPEKCNQNLYFITLFFIIKELFKSWG